MRAAYKTIKKDVGSFHLTLQEEKHQHSDQVPIEAVSASSLCQSLLSLRVVPAEQPVDRNSIKLMKTFREFDVKHYNTEISSSSSHFLWRNSPAATATGRWAE